jgi:hypothetical protein
MNLKDELKAEGRVHIAKHGTVKKGDDFFHRLAKVWSNQPLSERWTAEEVALLYAVMHGYLEDAYLSGWSEKKEEWAHSRETSWRRWVDYLVEVDGFDPVDARSFATKFFYAVDSVEAYT